MEQMLEIYLQYEAITESQRETIREQQELPDGTGYLPSTSRSRTGKQTGSVRLFFYSPKRKDEKWK